jgi:lipopolysaccharide export system protein LptA
MMVPPGLRRLLPCLLMALVPGVAAAEQKSGIAQGLGSGRDQPVQIESTSLEVRDKSRMATFIGNVKMTQGDTTVQCKTLVVYYEDSSGAPAANAKGGAPGLSGPGGGKQSIKRMEAKGNVVVTQKDQTASGDNGLFDVKSNSVTLIGNVVVTQGQNVLNGERMTVDLNTGLTRVESKGGGPVKGLFFPNQQKDTKAAPQPGAPPAAPPRSTGPMRIN